MNRYIARWHGLLPALVLASLAARPLPAVIVISEIMYHAEGGNPKLEYIELLNETPDPMDITGYYFSAGVTFTFTERTFLDPGAYIVVCADQQAIKDKYGITNVAGDWEPETSLDNSGEAIELSNPGGVVEARVRYNDRGKWPSGADGTGHSLEIRYAYSEMDDPDMWALSGVIGGSPGKANDTAAGALPLFINEALLKGAAGTRWIEIYNDGAQELDISGYQVTTDRYDLKKGVLPAGTVVAAGKYAVLTEAALGLDFSQDTAGRTFIALAAPGGTRVIDAFIFEPGDAGLSEARIPDGDADFSPAADPTPNATNRITVNRDVVINEVMYHPIDGDPSKEYIELYNRGAQSADLAGWSLSDGVRFTFPAGTSIAAGGYLVVARDPAKIRSIYGLAADKAIGPTDQQGLDDFGNLADDGERITLSDTRGNKADTVRYYDGGEWPHWADGGGSSMELIDPEQDNAVAQAWDSSDDSAKAQIKPIEYQGTFSAGEGELHLVMTGAGIALVDDIVMSTRVSTLIPEVTFVNFADTWKYFKGRSEASTPVEAWREPDFDDSTWLSGQAIIGFGDGDETTILDDMKDGYVSVFFRKTFDVTDPNAFQSLVLDVEYDDGFAAYLNGVEIQASNMRAGRAFDQTTPAGKEKAKESIDLTTRRDLLRVGKNVLAVQVHNQSLASTDFRWRAQLAGGHFEIASGPNLLKDGNFDTDAYKPFWTIQGTHVRSGRTTEGPLSGVGSFKVISSGGGDNKVNRIETSNSGMTTPQARVTYNISFLTKWVVGTPSLLTHGAYSGSAAPSYAGSHRFGVPENLGTPGTQNSVTARRIQKTGAANLGPVIWKVRQSKALPGANEAVIVAARISDPDGVGSVTLYYTLDTPKAVGDAAVLALPMEDPDGDGVYEATVPGQIVRKRVVFHIVATDAQGREGRYPLDIVNRTHPLLVDPAAAGVNDQNYVVYRHDTPYTGKPQSYRFWLHQANENYLNSRPLHANDLVDGTLVFQNRDIYYNSKVRFSGSPWARGGWTESYRFRLPKDNPMHGAIESFNTEDHQGAGGRDAKERISHYLIRWQQGPGIAPYSLQWIVQLQVNDKVNEPREHVQTPNGEFLKRWWPGDDDGSFFEMDDRHVINDSGTRQESIDGRLLYPPYGPATGGPDKEQYRYYFSLRGREDEDDFSQLVDFAKLMTQSVTPNDQFDAQVFDRINVDALCRVWAIRMNTDDWDQWGGSRGKNCYIYRPNGDGRWYLIPWDMELTYGNVSAFLPPTLTASSNPTYNNAFQEVGRFINRPQVKRIYYGVMKEMIDKQFRSAFLAPYMQKLDSIQLVSTTIGKPNGYIDQKRNLLNNIVRGVSSPTIEFAVTSPQPIEVETEVATVEGRAPVEIRFIQLLIDGEEADASWKVQFSDKSVLGWSASGPLSIGEHTLEFIGQGAEGQMIASTEVKVTRVTLTPPSIVSIAPDRLTAGEHAIITGTGFRAGAKVLFGTLEVTPDASEPTRLDAVVPAGLPPGDLAVKVVNPNGLESPPVTVTIVAAKLRFVRGDADRTGTLEITDAVVALSFLFQGGPTPTCLDAVDADDDGALALTDAVVVLRHLFQGGTAPPAPYPAPGEDATADALDCALGLE